MKMCITKNVLRFLLPFAFPLFVSISVVGCASGMYSTWVSVEKNENGITQYCEMSGEDVFSKVCDTNFLPIKVEWKEHFVEKGAKEYKKGDDNPLHYIEFLFLFSGGIIPSVSYKADVFEAEVKTPIGIKTGQCAVEAKRWEGWLPLFLPFPGIARERLVDPKLPNRHLELEIKSNLITNIVSQFSREEYLAHVRKVECIKEYEEWKCSADYVKGAGVNVFEEKYREGWRERAALKERIRVIEGLREKRIRSIVKAELNELSNESEYSKDKIKNLFAPRLMITEEERLAGEAILYEFGMRFLPNLYSVYEKKKNDAIENLQIIKDEFLNSSELDHLEIKRELFNKVCKKFAKKKADYIVLHDELCYYWRAWRFNMLKAEELEKIDSHEMNINIFSENVYIKDVSLLSEKKFNAVEVDFADINLLEFSKRYAPETFELYKKLECELNILKDQVNDIREQCIQLDDIYCRSFFSVAYLKYNAIAERINSVTKLWQVWYGEYKVALKKAEEIDVEDQKMRVELQSFLHSLPDFMKSRLFEPVQEKEKRGEDEIQREDEGFGGYNQPPHLSRSSRGKI